MSDSDAGVAQVTFVTMSRFKARQLGK